MHNVRIFKRKEDIAKAYKYSTAAIDKHLADGRIIRISVEGVGKSTYYAVCKEWISEVFEIQKTMFQEYLEREKNFKS